MSEKAKVCLIVIYNHNFERNIPVIRKIYAGRFSKVVQVMPFYRGTDEDVVGVYEASYQFNGYLAQAHSRIRELDCTHYVVVADDMILNPRIDETNIIAELKLGLNDAFVSSLTVLTDAHLFSWPQGRTGMMYLEGRGNACEWRNFMPTPSEARRRFESHRLDWRNGVSIRLLRILGCGLRAMRLTPWQQRLLPPLPMLRYCLKKFTRNREHLPIETAEFAYPTAYGYSDFLVVPKTAWTDFCHYCGVFAAARQWVESAIPTALVLACSRVLTLKDVGWRAEDGVCDYGVRQKLEQDSNLSYKALLEKFPGDYLYIHPIKLSKWTDLP